MKLGLILATIAIIPFVGFSEDSATSASKQGVPHKKMTQFEILDRKGYKVNGGAVVKPGSKKGCVMYLNQQQRVPETVITAVADKMTKATRITVRAATVGKDVPVHEAIRSKGATLGIVVIDDPNEPVMLIAPEERWAKVNVAKLAIGNNGNEVKGEMLASRTRKELIRAYAYLCGGVSSQFAGNLINANSVQQLDSVEDGLPLDMVKRFEKYLADVGVTPERIATYRSACKEGWAPMPTNDVQKAIWDKVHSIPDKPIKIKYDAKRDAGK